MSGPRFHAARRIAAGPDRVWALLVDLPSWSAWNPTIVSIEGDVTPGGTVRLVAAVNQQRTFALRVTELVPPQRMVWASGMPLLPASFPPSRTRRWSSSGISPRLCCA